MKFKKIIFDIFVISAAFALFVLWHRNEEKDAAFTSTSLNHPYTIYLITADKGIQYWDYINQGAAEMASALGVVNYIWEAPEKRDTNLQIELLNNAVDDGADAILIAADDPKKLSSAVEDAKARGVKIIYVDSPAHEDAITTLATDNYEAGRLAGKAMISELEKQSLVNGTIGTISVTTSKENTLLREQGFREVIEEDARFQLLDTQYTDGTPITAQKMSERIIKENTDLVGLYGTSTGTTQGVGYAIKEDSNRIIGIGFDKTDIMMELLREGSLKALMVQNPYTMGYLGMAEALAALKGKNTGPEYINTGVSTLRLQEQ